MSRERRRNDFYGKARRLACGVLLYGVMPYAAAGQGLAAAKHQAPTTARAAAAVQSNEWMFLGVADPDGDRLLHAELAARTTLADLSVYAFNLTAGGNLLKSGPVADDVAALRQGLSLDLNLPGVGNVYLSLYSPGDERQGKRLSIGGDEDDTQPMPKTWSLGGSVEVVNTLQGRTVALVPQLTVDVDALLGVQGQFEAGLQYAHWQGANQRRLVDERVPQATVSWRF